MATRTCNC